MLARLFAVALLVLASAGGAHAHEGGTHRGFVSTVARVEPPVPGLLVSVYGGHERLSVRNLTQATIRFEERGIVLMPGEAASWAEPRIAPTAPPDHEGLIRNWRVPGSVNGEPFAIQGFLGYTGPVANEEGLPAWAVAVAAAAGVLALGAVLALPLTRRKGENERPETVTER